MYVPWSQEECKRREGETGKEAGRDAWAVVMPEERAVSSPSAETTDALATRA